MKVERKEIELVDFKLDINYKSTEIAGGPVSYGQIIEYIVSSGKWKAIGTTPVGKIGICNSVDAIDGEEVSVVQSGIVKEAGITTTITNLLIDAMAKEGIFISMTA